MKKTISLVLVLTLGLVTEITKADFTFGQPVNLGSEINSPQDDFGPEISADGLALYIATDRPGGKGDTDVWVSTRPTKNDEWGSPVHLEGPLNTSYAIWEVSLTADGLQLYFSDGPFSAIMPSGHGYGDVWMATRSSTSESFGPPVNMPAVINSDHAAWADISPDGLELYITSHRTGSIGACDIWMAKRASEDSPWGSPVNLGSDVNSGLPDQTPDICYDGLTLFWAQGVGPDGMDLWMARREDQSQPFGAVVALPDGVNTTAGEFGPCLSPDGTVLYFSSNRSGGLGGFDLWQVPIEPICDFNNDLKVDSDDMHIMVDHWGENYPLCDIGPTPFGDGIVDIQDMIVLTEHLYRLTAHWKLDENDGIVANDSYGDHDGTLNGNPFWQPIGGMIDGSLMLDGIDDYIDTPFILDPSEGSFSVFAWVYSWMPGQVIISQKGEFGGTWLGTNPSGKLMTGFSDVNFGALESELVITDVQWHHVGFVYDMDTLHRRLYVDGILVAEDTSAIAGVPSDDGLYIGASKDLSAGTLFSGFIDDVRIYNQALSAKEIEALAR
jgi:hypothetical protein